MTVSKRQKQKDSTRKHLLDIAIHEFGQKGIIATKTADIAEAAGVSHGTIFAHFSTQEDLLTAVTQEFGDRIAKRLHELVDTDGSLYDVLKAHIEGLAEFEPFYTRLIIERRLLPESVCNTYIMIQSTISFHISIAAQKEMDQNIIRKIPIHLVFNTWIGMIHYYMANDDLFSPDSSVLKQYGEELLKHFMDLITL